MSEMKFTPGPWRLAGDQICAGLHDEKVIAAPYGDTTEEARANAHLIAAAPDLYAALVTARVALIAVAHSAVEAGFDRLADIIDEQLGKANAALAKARGETA